MVEVNRNQFKL